MLSNRPSTPSCRNPRRATGVPSFLSAFALLVAVASPLQPSHANAQSNPGVECVALLAQTIRDRVVIQELVSDESEFHRKVCEGTESAGSGSAVFDFFGLVSFGAQGQAFLRDLYCENVDNISRYMSDVSIVLDLVSPQAVNILQTCVQLSQTGLVVQTQRFENSIVLDVAYRPVAVGAKGEVSDIVTVGPVSCEDSPLWKEVHRKPGRSRPVRLRPQFMSVVCQRTDTGAEVEGPAQVIIFTDLGGSIVREVPRRSALPDVNLSALITAIVTDLFGDLSGSAPAVSFTNQYWTAWTQSRGQHTCAPGEVVVGVENNDSGHWFGDSLRIACARVAVN